MLIMAFLTCFIFLTPSFYPISIIYNDRRTAVKAIEALQQKHPSIKVFLPHHANALGPLPYAHFLEILKGKA